ncbi:hypothetical protein LCGC14_1234690 [marine sediment metagenome]|uniref:Bacterial sugar transferase domain-containing protein n=1 Tax=marine sediment metagenome TaxID=412755 RepID=A0A0F9NPR7_9ZZZZ|nr:sugar transferase [Candidatus Aminicenantes bacterium]
MIKVRGFLSLVLLVLSDISALFASFLIAYYFRIKVLPAIIPGLAKQALSLTTHLRYGFAYATLIVIFVLIFEKLYTKRLSFWDEAKHLLKGIMLSFILIMMIVFISRGYTQYSRPIIIIAGLLSLFLFPLFRLVVKNILVKIGFWKRKIIILGTNKTARLVAQGIKMNPTLGYEILGFLTEHKITNGEKILDNIKVLGKVTKVQEISKKFGVQDIVIVLPDIAQDKLRELVEICETEVGTIRVVPKIGSLFALGVEIESLGDVLSLSVARNLVKPWNLFIKRSLELICALLLFVIFLPIFFIIGLAIKTDSPGPLIFAHERLGKKKRIFRFYKFRSMFVDGDLKLNQFLKENSLAKEEWKKYRKIKQNDPRVTRVGKFIRKYSLDELPQLINVIKGDMNLVGPRPYMPREKEDIGKSYPIISRVRPGITGLWQVRGRNILPFEERLFLDEYYIRNWSLWLDTVILLKTLKVFFTREGAY